MTGSPYGAYTNDMAGNRTGEAGCVNHWDEVNRLAAISTTASGYSDAWFDYRADGMRAREYYEAVGGGGVLSGRAGGATTMGAPFGELHRERLHRYDEQMPMEVVAREGPGMAVASVRRHALGARGIDRIETWTPSSGTDVAYPVYDGHGNRIQALRRGQFAGGVPADMPAGGRTDPWGVFNGGRTHPAAQYCANLGHPTDGETGLVYMRARYYEPWTGRFLSEDPARDGGNWYVYCEDDPTNLCDDTGLSPGLPQLLNAWRNLYIHPLQSSATFKTQAIPFLMFWTMWLGLEAAHAPYEVISISQKSAYVADLGRLTVAASGTPIFRESLAGRVLNFYEGRSLLLQISMYVLDLFDVFIE
jgi:RHS repeat-associated protein